MAEKKTKTVELHYQLIFHIELSGHCGVIYGRRNLLYAFPLLMPPPPSKGMRQSFSKFKLQLVHMVFKCPYSVPQGCSVGEYEVFDSRGRIEILEVQIPTCGPLLGGWGITLIDTQH